jgi:aspartate--ammonia ligase
MEKRTDLAGPGVGSYEEVEQLLPTDYTPLLPPKQRMQAVFAVKRYMEDHLCRALNLQMVPVPLVVERDSGMNDYLDRDGSRTPVEFHIANDHNQHPIEAQIVQAATKWKRYALKQFDCGVGEGICTDMRSVRKDYFLDHDHSCCGDQWDWERVVTAEQRNLAYLKETVQQIWTVIRGAGAYAHALFPELRTDRYPDFPQDITFLHAEELLERYPNLPRKERETRILQEHHALFLIGIGWALSDGYPHELRAADYDDWVTETHAADGRLRHGLNGDILVWNPVTRRRHELSSMGIRVTKETLQQQLAITGQTEFLRLPYHQMILHDDIPLSIGGGIGQARTLMYLLRTAHLGEVSVSVWPQILKEMCQARNIQVLE